MNNNLFRIALTASSTKITIIPIEAHESSRKVSNGFCRGTWRKFITRVKKDPFCFAVFVGDMIDSDRPTMREMLTSVYSGAGRRPAREEADDDHRRGLREGIIKDLLPIKHKILGMVDGDHFRRYADGTTSTQYIAEQLGIPNSYLGERMGWIRLIFKKCGGTLAFDILVRHGKSSTSTIGADINKLISQNIGFMADLFIGGHTHKKWFISETFLFLNKMMQIKHKIVGYARAGSLLRGFIQGETTYPELCEYRPLSIGWPEIYIYIGRPKDHNGAIAVVDMKGLS